MSCGRIGFDESSGAGDGGSTDAPIVADFNDLGPFPAADNVAPVSDPATDAHPTLTADQLELYYASTRAGDNDIWRTTRVSLDAAWSAPERVDELSSDVADDSPELSADGLEIFFASRRGTDNLDIWTSTRASRSAPWTPPVVVPELNSSAGDHSPFVDAAGTTMVLTSQRAGGAGARDLYIATRADRGSAWSTPVAIAGLNTSGQDADAFLDATGRFLLFSSDRDSGDFRDLYLAQRPNREAPFGPAELIDELNTARADADPWVSPDLRTIVFSSSRDGDDDIFVSTR